MAAQNSSQRSFVTSSRFHHRLTSVGFAHANSRAELAVKSAKRLLRENMLPTGQLNNDGVPRALLQYCNTTNKDHP